MTVLTFIPFIVSSVWIDWYNDVAIQMGNLQGKIQNAIKHGTFLFLSVSMGGGAFTSFLFRHKCARNVRPWAEIAAFSGIFAALPTLLFLYPIIESGNVSRNIQIFTVGMFVAMIGYTFALRLAVVNGLPKSESSDVESTEK